MYLTANFGDKPPKPTHLLSLSVLTFLQVGQTFGGRVLVNGNASLQLRAEIHGVHMRSRSQYRQLNRSDIIVGGFQDKKTSVLWQ